jgi:hypothetical protein
LPDGAHHILFKEGLSPDQEVLAAEGQAILKEAGIDPIFGLENLIWAPWRVDGQHHIDTLQQVVDRLKAVKADRGTREDFVEALKALGKEARKRTTTKNPIAPKPPKAQKANSEMGAKSAGPANNAAKSTTTENRTPKRKTKT